MWIVEKKTHLWRVTQKWNEAEKQHSKGSHLEKDKKKQIQFTKPVYVTNYGRICVIIIVAIIYRQFTQSLIWVGSDSGRVCREWIRGSQKLLYFLHPASRDYNSLLMTFSTFIDTALYCGADHRNVYETPRKYSLIDKITI